MGPPKPASTMKATIRKEILSYRDSLDPSLIKKKSHTITDQLKTTPQFVQSRMPMLYASFRGEVHTISLIRERLKKGLPVALPRSIVEARRLAPYLIRSWERDIAKGAYGIPEPNPESAVPVSPSQIDLVVVPGSVFGKDCTRHGYGGGFYDRFLSRQVPHAYRIGLAFSFQVLEFVPSEPHDQKMDLILTEETVIMCEGK